MLLSKQSTTKKIHICQFNNRLIDTILAIDNYSFRLTNYYFSPFPRSEKKTLFSSKIAPDWIKSALIEQSANAFCLPRSLHRANGRSLETSHVTPSVSHALHTAKAKNNAKDIFQTSLHRQNAKKIIIF